MTERRPRRPLFALVTVVLFFGAAEFVASRVNLVFPTWGATDNPSVVLTGHPTRLWGLTEGKRQNLDTVATVNALGLRGEEPVMPRPAGEQRIVILGDSTFFGFGVADEHTLASVLQNKIPNSTVINAGIPGYSTDQTIRLLDEVIWDLDPTLLVVANFWSDTSFEPYRDKDLLATQDVSNSRILAHSALMRWLATTLSGLREPERSRIVTWVHGNELPPATQRRVELLDYGLNLDAIIRAAAERGVGALLLTPPSPIEITGEVDPPHQWDAYTSTQEGVAEYHGVPHILSTRAFRSVYEDTNNLKGLFLDDLHPSVDGQALLATVVQRALNDVGWPENRLLGRLVPYPLIASYDMADDSFTAPPDGNNSPTQNLFVDPSRSQPAGNRAPAAKPAQLQVSIQGGVAPYSLTVTHAGSTVASARIPEARSVSLRVPVGEVDVRVEDATGAVQQLSGSDGTPLDVVFP